MAEKLTDNDPGKIPNYEREAANRRFLGRRGLKVGGGLASHVRVAPESILELGNEDDGLTEKAVDKIIAEEWEQPARKFNPRIVRQAPIPSEEDLQ